MPDTAPLRHLSGEWQAGGEGVSLGSAMAIEIVCFDLGGVLVRTCHSWAEGCKAAGLEIRMHREDAPLQAIRVALIDELGLGRLAEAQWAEQLSHAWEGLYSPAEIVRIHYAWTQGEYDGVGVVIDALHDAGVETSCLSNTNHAHFARLVHHDGSAPLEGEPEYPTVRRLHRHFASHLLGLAKPDPAIYAAFEQATERAGPSILFFDDRPENVAAARARGWNAEPIDPRTETGPQLGAWLREYRVI
jgi:FMN phosphatase YigB (HAD superfamily)